MTIEEFAEAVHENERDRMKWRGFDPDNPVHVPSLIVKIRPGKKYTKVDVGDSGKYMVDQEGNIYGIKAYGVIHRGHKFGTLDNPKLPVYFDRHKIGGQ